MGYSQQDQTLGNGLSCKRPAGILPAGQFLTRDYSAFKQIR
jgi:hypothetical protein